MPEIMPPGEILLAAERKCGGFWAQGGLRRNLLSAGEEKRRANICNSKPSNFHEEFFTSERSGREGASKTEEKIKNNRGL